MALMLIERAFTASPERKRLCRLVLYFGIGCIGLSGSRQNKALFLLIIFVLALLRYWLVQPLKAGSFAFYQLCVYLDFSLVVLCPAKTLAAAVVIAALLLVKLLYFQSSGLF